MIGPLLPFLVAACMVHPGELDLELGRRALPWLPPDLARQVQRRPHDFARGAAAAAAWPRKFHQPGTPQGLEATIQAQCERLLAALRARLPFSEVVAGFGTLAHLTLDADTPFAGEPPGQLHALAFSSYLRTCTPRIPIVFYGQEWRLVTGPPQGLGTYLASRRRQAAALSPLVRADLDRLGGPNRWRLLDDRSTSFAAASLTLNHATSVFANLCSWVWYHAGGWVPETTSTQAQLLVWKGEPKPRDAPSSRFSNRKARP